MGNMTIEEARRRWQGAGHVNVRIDTVDGGIAEAIRNGLTAYTFIPDGRITPQAQQAACEAVEKHYAAHGYTIKRRYGGTTPQGDRFSPSVLIRGWADAPPPQTQGDDGPRKQRIVELVLQEQVYVDQHDPTRTKKINNCHRRNTGVEPESDECPMCAGVPGGCLEDDLRKPGVG